MFEIIFYDMVIHLFPEAVIDFKVLYHGASVEWFIIYFIVKASDEYVKLKNTRVLL